MKAIAIAVILALESMAFAQEQQICLDQVEVRNIATYIKRTEAENEALKTEIKNAPSPALLITVSAVLGIVLGGSVAYGVVKATQKP